MSKLTIEYENEKFNCFVDGEKLEFITSIYCVGSIHSKNLIISTISMDDIVNIVDVPEETVNLHKKTVDLLQSIPQIQVRQEGLKVL